VNGLLKEPLLHFLATGALAFCVNAMVNTPSGEGGGSSVVVVGEAWLVRFLQYLSQNPAKERALARLEALSPAQRQQLIDAYVREEVLHREAQALGLDKNDQAIRQRLVQRMRAADAVLAGGRGGGWHPRPNGNCARTSLAGKPTTRFLRRSPSPTSSSPTRSMATPAQSKRQRYCSGS